MKRIFQRCSKGTTGFRRCNTGRALKKTTFDKNLFSVTTSLGTVNLFSIALPMLVENILMNMLSTVNTLVLSGFSQDAVAAIGAVSPVIGFVSLFFLAMSTGATVIVSNYIGAEYLEKAARAVCSAIITCIGVAVAIGLMLFPLCRPITVLLNLSGVVADYAFTYLQIRILALPVAAISSILLAVLRCYGYAKATVVAGLSSNICNLLLSLYVVRGNPPAICSGVTGVALACVAGQLLSMGIAITVFCRKRIEVRLPAAREFASLVGKMLRIGVPSGLSSGSLTLSQIITTPFIATLGVDALSAKVYYSSVLCYTYSFSYSVGSANSLLVGRLCGAGKFDHAEQLNRQLVRITTAVNFAVSVLMVLLRIPILSLFTDNGIVLKAALGIFLIDILAEQARAISQVYEYGLRAAGDVTFTTVLVIASCWVCGVGLSYLLSIPCGLGLAGYWIAVSVDESVRAIASLYRWRMGRWRHRRL